MRNGPPRADTDIPALVRPRLHVGPLLVGRGNRLFGPRPAHARLPHHPRASSQSSRKRTTSWIARIAFPPSCASTTMLFDRARTRLSS